jgi:hypothetical protein
MQQAFFHISFLFRHAVTLRRAKATHPRGPKSARQDGRLRGFCSEASAATCFLTFRHNNPYHITSIIPPVLTFQPVNRFSLSFGMNIVSVENETLISFHGNSSTNIAALDTWYISWQ